MKEEGGVVFGKNGKFKLGIQHWVGCGSCDWKYFLPRNMLPRLGPKTKDTWSLDWLVFFFAIRKRN